jgi:hypothetical protein
MIPADKLEGFSMNKLEKQIVDAEYLYFDTLQGFRMAFWLKVVLKFEIKENIDLVEFSRFLDGVLHEFSYEVKTTMPVYHLSDYFLTDLQDEIDNESVLKLLKMCIECKKGYDRIFGVDPSQN